MKHIIVVGAGAAGLMAATIAAREGAKVTLLEKMNMIGKKMGITGKGRCNITNDAPINDFIAKTPGNGKFLMSAYQQFDNRDLLDLLHDWKLATKVERGGRVFPVSDSALEVRDMFMRVFKGYGGTLHLNEAVKRILVKDNCVQGVVTDLRPSLVPLETKEAWVKDLMGLSLRNVELSVVAKDKVQAKQFGEMMFTHFGITGPIVLSLSHTVGKLMKKKNMGAIQLEINLKQALTMEQLDQRIQRDFVTYSKKQLANGLKDLLPQRLIPVIIELAKLEPDKFINQVSREERQRLVHVLQHMPLTFKQMRPIAEAIVTAGGISVKEFVPKTMESKVIKGLYGAGEVLDIDAFTGGYNLQAAFATGYVAARHAVLGDEAEQ